MMPFVQCSLKLLKLFPGNDRCYHIRMLQKRKVLHQLEYMTYSFCFGFLFQQMQSRLVSEYEIECPSLFSVLIINLEPVFLLATRPTCVCFTVLTLPDVELCIKSWPMDLTSLDTRSEDFLVVSNVVKKISRRFGITTFSCFNWSACGGHVVKGRSWALISSLIKSAASLIFSWGDWYCRVFVVPADSLLTGFSNSIESTRKSYTCI